MDSHEFRRQLEEIAEGQAKLNGSVVDPTIFLPGEDPDGAYLDDSRHWAAVYRELVALKKQVVEDLVVQGDRLSEDARPEVDRDRQLMELELRRLRLHLDFWESRER